MRTHEEVINVELSRILNEKLSTKRAVPEIILPDRRRPDLLIKPLGSSSELQIYLEAKVSSAHKPAAFKQALSHLQDKKPEVFACVALCYPEEMRDISDTDEINARLRSTNQLHFAGITNRHQVQAFWDVGDIKDLSSLIQDIESGDLIHVERFISAVDQIAAKISDSDTIDSKLSEALKITVNKEVSKKQVMKIAALIWLNAAMMQIRLHNSRRGASKSKFPDIEDVSKEPNQVLALLRQWKTIYNEIDYAYIFYPAAQALEVARSSISDVLGKEIIRHAQELAVVMGNIRLDYAGPLYHKLLHTAQNDGSFYTTTEAAKLLIALTLPDKHSKYHAKRLSDLRIIDPACGTGTLLVAAMEGVKRKIQGAGKETINDAIHQGLVEKSIYGCDINRHAVHLAACMLAFANPSVDYREMNLYRFKHGIDRKETHAGSLEILGLRLPGDNLLPFKDALKVIAPDGRKGEVSANTRFGKEFDLVVMNPPYTRNSLRSHHHSKQHRQSINAREREIAREFRNVDAAAAEAIKHSSIQTYFPPLADQLLLDDGGIMASVLPTTVATGADAAAQRIFTAKRFHIETFVTSHDPRKPNFSGETGINESLIVARKGVPKGSTRFINLRRNPSSILEVLELISRIRKDNLEDWGMVSEWPREKIEVGDWTPALFYNPRLLELITEIRGLTRAGKLTQLGKVANVGPSSRSVRGACDRGDYVSSSTYHAAWYNPASEINKIALAPDSSIFCKKGVPETRLEKLWKQRSHLLLPDRIGVTDMSIFAAWSNKQTLGNAWVPVNSKEGGGRHLESLVLMGQQHHVSSSCASN